MSKKKTYINATHHFVIIEVKDLKTGAKKEVTIAPYAEPLDRAPNYIYEVELTDEEAEIYVERRAIRLFRKPVAQPVAATQPVVAPPMPQPEVDDEEEDEEEDAEEEEEEDLGVDLDEEPPKKKPVKKRKVVKKRKKKTI